MMEQWTDTALARLRASSGRSGGARRVVVEFLGRQDCCLSAQEIHDAVRGEGARIGIASVYRALEGLDELGLAQRVDLGDGVVALRALRSTRRAPPPSRVRHCGKVEPFEDRAIEDAIERVAGGRGYDVAAHDVVLRGACGDCRPAG